MKTFALFLLAILAAQAAPSVSGDEEIYLPLESASSVALIDRATGQVRFLEVTPSNEIVTSAPVPTELPLVTGATSGFLTGGQEHIVLSSGESNRLAVLNTVTSIATPQFANVPGPQSVALVTKLGGGPRDLIIAHPNIEGRDALGLYRDPAGSFSFLDDVKGLNSLSPIQSLYDAPGGDRYAVTITSSGGSGQLIYLFESASNNIGGGFRGSFPAGSQPATNIRRDDNALMLATFREESNSITLSLVSFPFDLPTTVTRNLPRPVKTLSTASGSGAAGGFLATYLDGTAEWFTINAANNLNSQQTFAPTGGDPIRALLSVPGRGVIALSGPKGFPSQLADYFAWNGADFSLKDSTNLPSLISAVPDFATLFWFSSEPLVNPSAALLQLDCSPDWTSNSPPPPLAPNVNVFVETYVDSVAGLDNPTSTNFSTPPGSTHLLTNQISDTISLTALDTKLALTLPPINVTPPGGLYQDPIEATVLIDDDAYRSYYRENTPGAPWQLYRGPITVSYPSTWQFYSENLSSGALSPIVSRSWTFDLADVNSFDQDADGVPDFVEREYGLSANSGPDADADGYTDLDEILNLSDPNDLASEPATSTTPFLGEGLKLLAQARNTGAGQASNGVGSDPNDGEVIDLHSMTSALLGSAPVEFLSSPPILAGQLAATLNTGSSISVEELLVLNSPPFFFLDGAVPEVKGGREIYKLIPHPDQAAPVIAPVLSGTDRTADAASWVAAATAAHGSFQQVSTISNLVPDDTAVAALVEAALLNALNEFTLTQQIALGVPQLIPADSGPPAIPAIPQHAQFTLFGKRDKDSERSPLTATMRDALTGAGLSFDNLLTEIETSFVGATNLKAIVAELYNYHVAHSNPTAASGDLIPLLPLPLDALRSLIYQQSLPEGYEDASISGAEIAGANSEIATALATLNNAYRPVETWTIEVKAPTLPGDRYLFEKMSDLSPVRLFEADGDPLNLDQGLGIAIGTTFSIRGYTDVTAPAPYDALEVISLEVLSVPLSSDSDTNGNLLADDWEEFFFGGLGEVGPYDTHPVNGYTYLQLYLIGHDPRADCDEVPVVPALLPAITNFKVLELPGGNIGIRFDFPADYLASFEFKVQQSADLAVSQPFADIAVTDPDSMGGDTWQFNIGSAPFSLPGNFFRIGLALPAE